LTVSGKSTTPLLTETFWTAVLPRALASFCERLMPLASASLPLEESSRMY